MAERKATNKYYPPEWDPSKGSINTFRGSHPLRERARKLHQGILIIRFELPFNIWCDGCNNHIGMGVRYNAQKSKVGMYYTTPLYKFRMKCHLCDNHFEIQNDPKNLDYIILNGARRQENRWDPTENEQIEVDKTIAKKNKLDPMFQLESKVLDKNSANEKKSTIENLEKFQNRLKDDYSINCLLRKKFRNEKKELNLRAINDVALLRKSSLPIGIRLVAETSSDTKMAKLMTLQSKESPEQMKINKRKKILSQSIFGTEKCHLLSASKSRSLEDKKSGIKQSLNDVRFRRKISSPTNAKINSLVNYDDEDDND
ncbi:Coiled-coil domain-containing protein -like protein [Sarcoptes scabiei]|uniref:Coiled-coil domain-containing protein -like protein n=1 Tax=Sarcoptes scabiei TaxID=52283 RepID=A0A834RK40_SARSC|nr:Coiled-coil domain-containing protein -like protein [Sarcoptes scabiei]UXI17817.1 U4/U6 small nuclear ribonucleoprotein Prp31 [Sarcoptes scabiei]